MPRLKIDRELKARCARLAALEPGDLFRMPSGQGGFTLMLLRSQTCLKAVNLASGELLEMGDCDVTELEGALTVKDV